MKRLKFLSIPGIALVFIFSSCGGDETKTSDTSVTTDTTATTSTVDTTTTTPTQQSTIDTMPSTTVIVWQRIGDFAKWKSAYDGHDSARLANGVHNYIIGRSVSDSNTVLVALKADDLTKAKAFAKDPSLKSAMQKGGVKGAPSILFCTVVYVDKSTDASDLRSMSMFTVKDWNTWKTSFEGRRQLRTDNGLTDRAYGHDADDDHKVVVVGAIGDSTKAAAYWNSDLLKQKREESGVVGEVKRYVYRVVQKY